MRELALNETEQVGGGMSPAAGYLLFIVIGEIGVALGWWNRIP